jgi:tetratricopeptide (TPR) repeat protein
MTPANHKSLLMRGMEAHRDGDLAAAAAAYRDVLAADPDDVDATHYLGMISYQRGDLPEAVSMLGEAVKARPDDSAILANLGLVMLSAGRTRAAATALERSLQVHPDQPEALVNLALTRIAQDNADAAADCYRRVLEITPGRRDARLALGQLLVTARRYPAAQEVLDAGLALDPTDSDMQIARAQILELKGAVDEASSVYQRIAAESDSLRCRALTRLAATLRKSGRPAAALMAARSAAWSDTRNYAARHQIGQALKELGWLEPAADAFRQSHTLFRSLGVTSTPELPTFTRTSRAKLRHDTEQIGYLLGHELVESSVADIQDIYRNVMTTIPEGIPDGKTVLLPAPVRQRFAPFYNRCLHYRETPGMEGSTLNPELDCAAIQADYERRAPGITWVDDLLVPEALEALRAFCLESTIWYDFEHSNGYVGAYLQEGFNCPLLIQIAEELPRLLPAIFGDHVLMQMWAYKYDSKLAGIDMHADFAAVNVNFWITPSKANLDPGRGGLVLWDKEAPAEWGIDDYNTYDPQRQQDIRDYLESNQAQRVVVPHRQNRCVIFNSDLFHKTDDIEFADRYEDRRINITLLYGTRDEGDRGRRS